MPNFQTVGAVGNTRTDHIWRARDVGKGKASRVEYKCILCGAVTASPPAAPTPDFWLPRNYEAVTNEERALEPYVDPYIARA